MVRSAENTRDPHFPLCRTYTHYSSYYTGKRLCSHKSNTDRLKKIFFSQAFGLYCMSSALSSTNSLFPQKPFALPCTFAYLHLSVYNMLLFSLPYNCDLCKFLHILIFFQLQLLSLILQYVCFTLIF